MLKSLFLGLALLSTGAFGMVSAGGPDDPRVICCGRCRSGEDCLKKCRVQGKVPEDLRLTCCGKCEAGRDCLRGCVSAR